MGLDVKALFATIDRMDAPGFSKFFAEDGLFRFGNAPTVKGRSEISSTVEQFFASIKALEHRVIETWNDRNTEICEVDVTYTRHDNTQIDLMAACVFRMRGEFVADYRIYMDISPLYEPA
jgi:ketosteroid isomerase-like protein